MPYREFIIPEKNFEVKAGERLSLSAKQVSLRGQDIDVIHPALLPGGQVEVRVRNAITFDKGEVIGLYEPPPPVSVPTVPAKTKRAR